MPIHSSPTVRRADIFFPEKDQALRHDVHRLGELVGEVVSEQGGEELFDLVESARRASIDHREGDAKALEQLQQLLGTLAPETATEFIRAFSTYFQVVNLAEKVHRIRRRRAYLRDAATPQPRGFEDIIARLKDGGVSVDTILAALAGLSVEPVFSAHPMEVTRRTMLTHQQSVARHLIQMLDPYLTPQEEQALMASIRMDITTSWQTEEHPREHVRVGDEAEHILFFLTDILYRIIPPFYEQLADTVKDAFPSVADPLHLPTMVRFGSWAGGDMDDNPDVTAKTIRETLARQKALVLNLYHRECGSLARHLSQSASRVEVSETLRARSAFYTGHFPHAAHAIPARHREMPYRVFLALVAARLRATHEESAFPYESPEEFIEDIDILADSLRANKGSNSGLFAAQRLRRRADTFGFHIATLDIRQNALVHRRVVGEGLQEQGWLEASIEERTARLQAALERRESPMGRLSSDARRTLAVFQTIAHCRRKYGARSIGPYIVSATHGPDDVLSVLLLARWGDLGTKGLPVPLDVVPLFETIEDLESSSAILERLLQDESYRAHLEHRGSRQMVMVGFSDSNRDGGVASARWTLQNAQRDLVTTLQRVGITLTLFHGRGSTLSRGGGRLDEALLASPTGAITGRLRITEQGDMINAKYGLRGIAMRSLKRSVGSLLWATVGDYVPAASEHRWRTIMGEIAATSRQAYKETVFDRAEFNTYFRAATPIDVIERLGMGSRPGVYEHLYSANEPRANPWRFAWTQNRAFLPGWFGLGTGLEQAARKHGVGTLRNMLADLNFFRVLITDAEVVLGKADLTVSERYSRLGGPLHEMFFPVIRDEFERCADLVMELTDQGELLQHSRTLRRAIRLRNPYVDPMSLLQVDLLKRWRRSGRRDDSVLQPLVVSIYGIAHGMQTTG